MTRPSATIVAVLGAGLAGASAALELAARGIAVTLLERDAQAFSRASLRNEGKIHLGLIYAADGSLATARLQLQGALAFRALLARWLGAGAANAALAPSTPFAYLVAHDSLLDADRLEAHYEAVGALCRAQLADDAALDYLGTRPARLHERIGAARLAPWLRMERFAAAFETAELAIDTERLAHAVRAALVAHPLIELCCGHRVEAVTAQAGGYRIEGQAQGRAFTLQAAQVVSALWEERLRIDRSVGLEPPPGWVHRLKYRVIARLPRALRSGPSVTMVLGPYGDVVVRGDGTAYFSWYPLGCKGWTHDVAPPASWDAPCRGELQREQARAVAAELLGAIDTWYPGAALAQPLQVDAGAIVGYGRTDVDDPASGLHDRTRVGVHSHDGYHSLDPGKLTTAPLFGRLAAERVIERL